MFFNLSLRKSTTSTLTLRMNFTNAEYSSNTAYDVGNRLSGKQRRSTSEERKRWKKGKREA